MIIISGMDGECMGYIEYDDDMELVNTDNLALISQVVESDDVFAKAFVAENPRLSYAQMMKLATDDDVTVRGELAGASHVLLDVLRHLSVDEEEAVRVRALCNPAMDLAYYSEALLNGKFSVEAKEDFCADFRAVEKFEVFKFLWESVELTKPILIRTLNTSVGYSHLNIDSQVLVFVQDEMRKGVDSPEVREVYAEAYEIALPEILDSLKDDSSRSVINAIAGNPFAWVSTHGYLADKYKGSNVPVFIAEVTKDNDLLNKIYHGTKSKKVRDRVEANPWFISH